jgi:CheY-like chemotaxis protein
MMAEGTILVVDDNEASRYVVARILRHAGYQVTEAATGGETLSEIARGRPDLVILDVTLPDTPFWGWPCSCRIRSLGDQPKPWHIDQSPAGWRRPRN